MNRFHNRRQNQTKNRHRRLNAGLKFESLEPRIAMAVTGFGLPAPDSIAKQSVTPATNHGPQPAAADIVVTNTNDTGIGSLRWAIMQANTAPGANRILFQLADNATNKFVDADSHLSAGDPQPDVFVIRPTTALPELFDQTGGTTIDGRSQTSFLGDTNTLGPEVVLDGSLLGNEPSSGLTLGLYSHHNQIAGLNIHSFPGDGISIVRSNFNRIFGNSIGTDRTGSEARPNGRSTLSSSGGILVSAGSQHNIIGVAVNDPESPGEPNLIATNRQHGIRFQTGAVTDQTRYNEVRGNAIGTLPLGNGGPGVLFIGIAGGNAPDNNVVEGNVIVGNTSPLSFINLASDVNQIANNVESEQQLDEQFQQAFGLSREEFVVVRSGPTAEFSWKMEERTGPGYQFILDDFHGQIPNVKPYVNPIDGYAITLDANGSRPDAGRTMVSYVWVIRTLGEDAQVVARATGLNPTIRLPEGDYSVSLVVTDSGGQTQSASGEIRVNDILIVSMGDSYAAGEGNPHIPVPPGGWAMGGDGLTSAQHQAAHRSIFSAPAQTAWLLEQNDPHTSVTFVSVASTGAQIDELFLKGQVPDVDRHYLPGALPRQLDQVLELTQRADDTYREIDRLFISAGGNDAGFGNVIEAMLWDDYDGFDAYPELVHSRIPARYAAMASSISTSPLNIQPANVYVTGYPDPTSDESPDGTPDEMMGDVAEALHWIGVLSGVDANEIRWVRANVIGPLNAALRHTANQLGWNFVDLEKALWGHGYKAENN